LVVAMELERTYLLVRTRDKITARLPVFIWTSRLMQTSWS
jgi:hypothetical protein